MLEIRDLTVVRGRRRAVNGATLTAEPGVLTLLGVNGAGKTTLLRSLATVQRFSASTAVLDGHDLRSRAGRARARKAIGYLPQMCDFPRTFTVYDLVTYMAWLHRVPSHDRESAVAGALATVDLSDRAGMRLGKLSGGMLRRAFLAQAIVHHPRVLLLDEPTAGLDPEQRIAFRSFIRRMSPTALTILSTHLVEDVAHLGSRVAILERGHFIFAGSAEQLAARGSATDTGDSPLERGFSAVRSASAAGAH